VSINDNNSTIKIKVSSKILGVDYLKGINRNTIEQVRQEINKTGIILKPDFINNSILNLIDIKNDLRLSLEPNNYMQALNLLTSPKFTKAKYPTGITFNENIKSNQLRLTAYGKEYEMKLNKAFYNEFPSLINSFDNVLRLESRFSSRKTIRKYFNNCNLLKILNSKNVNYNSLLKIIDNQTSITPVFNTKTMKNTDEKNFTQIYYLNDIYNGDFNAIMNHIKSKLSSNTKATYQRTKVKTYLAMINNSKEQSTLPNIIELQNALKEV
jgi:ubiquitin